MNGELVSGSDVGETNVFVVSPSRISSPVHARSDAFQVLPLSFSPHALYNVSVCYCIQWHLHLNGPSGTSCLVDRELTYVLRPERGETHPSALMIQDTRSIHTHVCDINPLKPNDHFSGRTAPLTSKRCILYIYSTNTGTEVFKHGILSPFLSL